MDNFLGVMGVMGWGGMGGGGVVGAVVLGCKSIHEYAQYLL